MGGREMEAKKILIAGSGHLAGRVKFLLEKDGYSVTQITRPPDAAFEHVTSLYKEIKLSSFSMVYLLDDKDDYNLESFIAIQSIDENVPATASLFNENITPHLQAAYKNLTVFNPARIAAPAFVEALYQPLSRQVRYVPEKVNGTAKPRLSDNLIAKLVAAFIVIIILTTIYFHQTERFSWIDAIYFEVVTVTTVGYGDISMLHSGALSKVVNMFLILSSTFFMWIIFSLIIDRIIKKRIQLALGRKQYEYKGHVIVCGLGRLGYFIVTELLKKGEKVVIVESNEASDNIDHFRQLGADVYIGNARLIKVLQDVNVSSAKAVLSVINNDYANLEIGLNARSIQPNLRLILRVFDELMAKQIKEDLDIHLTISMSAVADEKFVAVLSNQEKV